MEELISNCEERMSSLEIAEIIGKDHRHLLEAIRKMEEAWVKLAQPKFRLGFYKDKNQQERPCYYLTKTECLYVATKFSDEARAKLVLRWKELETGKSKPIIQIKEDDMAIDTKRAALYWEMAKSGMFLPKYSQILGTYAANTLAGKNILPLPKSEKKRYTATDIGNIVGISANKIGRLAKAHNLKTEEYGEWVEDTAKYNKGKQVRNFEYYDNAIGVFKRYSQTI